jgi:polyferredoxin
LGQFAWVRRHPLLRRLLLVIAILLIVDASLGAFLELTSPIGYFSGKSVARIVSDLAFVEGATFFFAGTLLAFMRSNLSSSNKALLVIGASLLGLSVVFGLFS